ncbi:MAG: hypothetical protein HC783_16310 [Rhodobacteraceae bacterium]|nr:hypothetical protein [Paracoccaceae bacterium]
MERRFHTGTVASAVGHLGVVLWVLVGDWLFAADKPPETITMTASTITSAEFDLLQAASTPTPSEETAPVRPQARPDPEPEPEPEPAKDEDKWATIPWQTDLWQARKTAAEQGKPILLWEMDGHPLGCT